jgi:hypothetical protein
MGWTSFPMHTPVKEWFLDSWNQTGKHEVLDVAIVKRNTLYAAIKYKETNEVFAVVYLLRWSPKSDYNFSYKDMDETVGPYECECPLRILNLLTPTTSEYALQWRERVRMYHKKKDELKNSIIRFTEMFEFTSGFKYNIFKKQGNKTFAGYLNNGKFEPITRVRINIVRYMARMEHELIPIN